MPFSLPEFLESGSIMSVENDQLLLGWGSYDKKQYGDLNFSKPAIYLNDFFLSETNPWLQYGNMSKINTAHLEEILKDIPEGSPNDWRTSSFDQFKEILSDLLTLFKSGVLKKAVPYIFAYSDNQMCTLKLAQSLKKALVALKKGNSYLYGQWEGGSGILGITPELLFSHSGKQPLDIYTMALAGTRPSQCSDFAFISNHKERREHELVVEGIQEDLKNYGSLKIGKLQVLNLSHLSHLLTPIKIHLKKSFDFEEAVQHLHPTPAVGTAPKKEGMEWLKMYQAHTPRSYYGAPIGFTIPEINCSQCMVGIRNVQWNLRGMRIGAGCGIIPESIFEQEWQEIKLKITAIQDQFGL